MEHDSIVHLRSMAKEYLNYLNQKNYQGILTL